MAAATASHAAAPEPSKSKSSPLTQASDGDDAAAAADDDDDDDDDDDAAEAGIEMGSATTGAAANFAANIFARNSSTSAKGLVNRLHHE